MMFIYTMVGGGFLVASTVTYVSLAPPDLRATLTALVSLFGTLIGGVLGPIVFGLINDVLKRTYGDESLRFTLLLAPCLLVVAGLLFLVSARTFEEDVRAAEAA
jgi:MFS family permease